MQSNRYTVRSSFLFTSRCFANLFSTVEKNCWRLNFFVTLVYLAFKLFCCFEHRTLIKAVFCTCIKLPSCRATKNKPETWPLVGKSGKAVRQLVLCHLRTEQRIIAHQSTRSNARRCFRLSKNVKHLRLPFRMWLWFSETVAKVNGICSTCLSIQGRLEFQTVGITSVPIFES